MAGILKRSLKIGQRSTDESALWSVNPRCSKHWEPHPRKQDHVQSCTLGPWHLLHGPLGLARNQTPTLALALGFQCVRGSGQVLPLFSRQARRSFWELQQYNYFIDRYKRDKGVWARYSHVCLQVCVIIMTHFCVHVLRFQFIWSLWSCPWSTCKQTFWRVPLSVISDELRKVNIPSEPEFVDL